MKLIFIGSGSAFFVGGNYHSNMILETDMKKRLLIDCGSDARHALYELGLSYEDLDAIYVSHLHSDHAGGLNWIGFRTKFDKSCHKITLYLHEDLKKPLWENALAASLRTIEFERATLDTFFNVNTIPDNGFFEWEGIRFHLVQTIHAMDGFAFIPSYGLFFSIQEKKIFITTDTQFAPHQLFDIYQQADIIFQDCETLKEPSGVHAHYSELLSLPIEIKKKMWLYHYNIGELPDAKGDGFCGFVQKGQVFDLKDEQNLK